MDETWIRIAVVAGLLGLGAATGLWRRRGPVRPPRTVSTSLPAGIHLFSSAGCATCATARESLLSAFGEDGFVEHSWEAEPDLFAELLVDAVPAVLEVGPTGEGTIYPGLPDARILPR